MNQPNGDTYHMVLLKEPLRWWSFGPESVALCEEGVPRDELDQSGNTLCLEIRVRVGYALERI